MEALEAVLVSTRKEEKKLKAADAFFRARAPEPDETTVNDLVSRTGIGKRSLQRVFNEYIGITPKWVIRRYRLHELMERLNSGDQLDLSDLALELGYFDQAHLINDFRSIVGYSPAQYQRLVSRNS